MKRALCMILALFCLCSLCGCEQEETVEWRNNTPSMNCFTAYGCFAYRDDFIYFADTLNLYEYDMVSGKTVILYGTDLLDLDNPEELYVTEDRIYCNMGGFCYITRDGKEIGEVFPGTGEEGFGGYSYIDGTDVFYVRRSDSSKVVSLFRRDFEIGEEELLFEGCGVYTYAVGPDKIYVVDKNKQTGDLALYVSDKEKVDFQRVTLPETINPVMVYPTADGAYFNVVIKNATDFSKSPNLYWYQEGKVEELPFPSGGPNYHVLGNKMIYQDMRSSSKTRSQSARALCIRDVGTGEKTVIDDSVFCYAVLEERYVCYWRPDDVHQKWFYYDLQTGQTTLMYEIEDSMALYNYSIG